MPTRNKAETEPNGERSEGVMEYMQKTDLIVLFPQDEEQRIEKIN